MELRSSCAETPPSGPPYTSSEGWEVLVHHGSCPVIQSGNVAVPFLEMQSEASDRFYTSSVNLTRSSCENGFLDTYSSTGGTASDWSDGLCLGVTTQMCLAESSTTELVRIVVHFSGSLTTSASLHVDGKPVASVSYTHLTLPTTPYV